MEWQENNSRLHTFIEDVSPTAPGIIFPRPLWVTLDRLRIGIGLFRLETHKWGMTSTAACECGTKEQTSEHVITTCPIYHYPNGVRVLSDIEKSLVTWLKETCPAI